MENQENQNNQTYANIDGIRGKCYERALSLYGSQLLLCVSKRLEKELEYIATTWDESWFPQIPDIHENLSISAFQPFGWGDVSSSLVAHLLGFTYIDPLPAHYHCNHCNETIFGDNMSYYTCFDLPDRKCPKCNQIMEKQGFDLLVENCFGLYGNKVPVIRYDVSDCITADRLLKLSSLTGITPDRIPIEDSETMQLLAYGDTTGIPEFDSTLMVRILKAIRPARFSDLIRAYGVFCGSNKNATALCTGKIPFEQIISCREDVYSKLRSKGMEHEMAIMIMEQIRKGKGLNHDQIKAVHLLGLPEWWEQAVVDIEYLPSKAYVASHVIANYYLAWFKAHYDNCFFEINEK